MTDREKVLRWDLQEAKKVERSSIGDCELVSVAMSIRENRRKIREEAERRLQRYLCCKMDNIPNKS